MANEKQQKKPDQFRVCVGCGSMNLATSPRCIACNRPLYLVQQVLFQVPEVPADLLPPPRLPLIPVEDYNGDDDGKYKKRRKTGTSAFSEMDGCTVAFFLLMWSIFLFPLVMYIALAMICSPMLRSL